MTTKEAIGWQKAFMRIYKGMPEGMNEACNMAIEALQKQEARVPIFSGDGYADGYMVYDTWECPCCGKQYDVDGIYKYWKHCPECGQAIDWSEQEESEE